MPSSLNLKAEKSAPETKNISSRDSMGSTTSKALSLHPRHPKLHAAVKLAGGFLLVAGPGLSATQA
jgi:hypothetical protein